MAENTIGQYQEDILGVGFEKLTLNFPNDYEGAVEATLIRKKSGQTSKKAVLYIHGFIDYFFQTVMAEQFNQHGFDFYALDLRKYGRSLLPHQKAYYVKDLREYDAEITQALNIIQSENHDSVLLCGHSTGGLITTLYAAHHPNHPIIKALWANSPFYDFNMNALKKKLLLPKISKLGQYLPNLQFPSELNPFYVTSIHQSLKGEWDFNLDWKPTHYSKVYLSFIHAIFEAQKEIHRGARLKVPALIIHSDRTSFPKKFNKDAQTTDVILDVKDIEKYAKKLQGNFNVMTIKSGIHDLVLSKPHVRAEVYSKLFNWLNRVI